MGDTHSITFKFGDRTYNEVIEGNLELSELTPDQVKEALNRAVGKFAFYASLRADAKRIEAKITTDFKVWEADRFNQVKSEPDYKKETGKVIDNRVIIEYQNEYLEHQRKIRDIAMITDKLYVLVQSFEMMTKTLQSVLAMLRAELGNVAQGGPAKGEGDFAE